MRELDQRIKSIAEEKNKEKLEQLIREWEFFILKSAVRVSKKYVSKQDEEWSVALEAFMEAVQRYDMDKGALTQVLQLYGLDFADLAKASPKSDKTVMACKKILFFLTSHPELTELIKDSKLLPLKEIEKIRGYPEKPSKDIVNI